MRQKAIMWVVVGLAVFLGLYIISGQCHRNFVVRAAAETVLENRDLPLARVLNHNAAIRTEDEPRRLPAAPAMRASVQREVGMVTIEFRPQSPSTNIVLAPKHGR